MTQLKHMALALTSLVFVPSLCLAQSYSSNEIGLAIMNMNAATLKGKTYSSNDIWGRIRQDFRLTEVNPELVRQQEQFYSSRSDYLNRMINRSQPYLYHIVTEAEKRKIPAEVALLPFIESAFVNKAKSRVGASGLWQFMPASGRQYGLEQNNLYDGRHDVYASTNAALNYLQYLHNLFGDWSLALAAYNWGEGNLGKAIKRAQLSGIEPTYENLRLPNETRNYVPKLLAVRNIIENPEAFGIQLASVPNKPFFEAINIDKPIDINVAARLANIPTSEFLTLNPSFKSPVFIPKPDRKLLLPVDAVNTFVRNYRQADKDSLLSWNIYTTEAATNIIDLAEQTGTNISEIKKLNNLSKNTVPAGRKLLLSKNSSPTKEQNSLNLLADSEEKSNSQTFTTANLSSDQINMPAENVSVAINNADIINTSNINQSNSTSPYLMKVALSSNSANSLTQANDSTPAVQKPMANRDLANVVKIKTNIAINKNVVSKTSANKSKVVTHKVKSGDTLFSIAQRYHLNVADLVTANNLRGHNIRPGLVLNIALDKSTPKQSNKTIAQNNKTKKANILPASYTIKKGDTLSGIAQKFNIPVSKLQKSHGTKKLKPGQKIKLTNL